MPGRNPPQCVIGTVEFLKPASAAAHYRAVRALINILSKSFHALPHCQVDNDHVVIVDLDASRIAAFGLEPPDKAGSFLRQSIDRRQLRYEIRHDRIVNRREHSGNVDLGDVILSHFDSRFFSNA